MLRQFLPVLLLTISILARHHILCSNAFSVGISRQSTSTASTDVIHRTSCRLHLSSKATTSWEKLTVPELKSQLKEWMLPTSGTKAELVRRLTEHDSLSNKPDQNPSKNTKVNNGSIFTPPKDEVEVQSMEKEVNDTIRMLEGLKLSGASSRKHNLQSQFSTAPKSGLSPKQQQQLEMMTSLQESLKYQQSLLDEKTIHQTKTDYLSPEEQARAELLQHHMERLRLRPANDLKEELTSLRLPNKGRKPDLVSRLAEYYVTQEIEKNEAELTLPSIPSQPLAALTHESNEAVVSFAGIPRLSAAAASALCQAFGNGDGSSSVKSPKPTPIQSLAIPKLFYPPQPSAILHAPTGSGKTLTYLLPITESLWREVNDDEVDPNQLENGIALILLPTRELAAQVAGVATVLAPRGMVRFVPHPLDLMKKGNVDAGSDFAYYEEYDDEADGFQNSGPMYSPRILVGSAKSISISLFGDGKMPGTPTRKPDGKRLLSSVRWLVLDEVDRLLNVKKTRTEKANKRHEKPAALLAAAVARLTMGRVQVIAASATVGRPLRRELSRVLGLHSSECPETLRGEEDTARLEAKLQSSKDDKHVGRAVKIPDTVKNYVLPVDGSTAGSLITSAAFSCKSMLNLSGGEESDKKILVVLTRNCDIKVHNALGALRHFGIQPEPQSLLDALEADGTDRLVEVHRRVSGVVGVGGSRQHTTNDAKGYILVTHEDNVRGLHLDGLDAVIVVGRPGSPDEYTHIAGRTGRAGKQGSVLNIVSYEQAAALASWSKMLGVDFLPLDESEVAGILDGY